MNETETWTDRVHRLKNEEIDRLRAENAELRKGIQDYLDGNYAGTHSKKVNQCPHGWYKWEVCQACIDEHFNTILAKTASAHPVDDLGQQTHG